MNGVLVIDKEKNKTSRDIVNDVCKRLGTKHIGHTGTLDPIATGVLVLGINDGCKIIELLSSDRKTYEACVIVGVETDTLDITGNIINKCKVDLLTKEKVQDVIDRFPRKYEQEVPIYSAIHVNGKRLYEYARNNIDVTLPKRSVEIYNLELISDIEKDDYYYFRIRVEVSKGTYIRSLIRDIGINLGLCCTMKGLRRIKQGIFDISDAVRVDDVSKDIKLIPIVDALKNYDKFIADDELALKVSNGMVLKFDTNSNILVIVDNNNNLLAIYQRYDKDPTMMKPFKVFKEEK